MLKGANHFLICLKREYSDRLKMDWVWKILVGLIPQGILVSLMCCSKLLTGVCMCVFGQSVTRARVSIKGCVLQSLFFFPRAHLVLISCSALQICTADIRLGRQPSVEKSHVFRTHILSSVRFCQPPHLNTTWSSPLVMTTSSWLHCLCTSAM